jgi:hypothetical protein
MAGFVWLRQLELPCLLGEDPLLAIQRQATFKH